MSVPFVQPALAYAVGVLSQFMYSIRIPHLEAEKEFCGILSRLLEKVFDMPLIDIFLFLSMKMQWELRLTRPKELMNHLLKFLRKLRGSRLDLYQTLNKLRPVGTEANHRE